MKKLIPFLLVLVLVLVLVRLARSTTWHEFITPVRRGFYSVCTAAIWFYLACLLRNLARFFRARTEILNRKSE